MFTANRDEPSSPLWLFDTMRTQFRNIGSGFLSVEGKFPVDGDGKTLPPYVPTSSRTYRNSSLETQLDTTQRQRQTRNGRMIPAGARGNSRRTFVTGFKPRASEEGKRRLLSLPLEQRSVYRTPRCGEQAKTVFEDTNPQTNLAGWSTKDGKAADAGASYCT